MDTEQTYSVFEDQWMTWPEFRDYFILLNDEKDLCDHWNYVILHRKRDWMDKDGVIKLKVRVHQIW